MDRDTFEALVSEALDSLPETFGRLLDNVSVTVEAWPTRQDLIDGRVAQGGSLFGLYRGIPHTKRGQYHAALPDRIVIFAGPIMAVYGHDPDAVREQIRKTVLHEIGHHFGMSDEEIRKTGH